jgi:hypothetical protein
MAPRQGYSTLADRVKTTADGTDLNTLWDEIQAAADVLNANQSAITSLLTYQTTQPSETVMQAVEDNDFEDASEFGVPKSLRATTNMVKFGFPFKWRDSRTGFTWQFLANASAAQVRATTNTIMNADERQLFRYIMRALLTKTTVATRRVNEDGVPIYSLWDGEADATPPDYAGQSFPAGHQHYLTTGGVTVDGIDLRDLLRHVTHHGYGPNQGDQLVVLCNPTEGETISGFRVATGSPFDFIPADDAPAYLTTQTIMGDRPSGDFQGLRVIGSFGDALIVQNYLIPAGYVIALATGGANSDRNPVAFRQHPNAGLQGLLNVGGNSKDYPLIDSYWQRGFGCGVRHRGAAAVMQVTASATYTNPAV